MTDTTVSKPRARTRMAHPRRPPPRPRRGQSIRIRNLRPARETRDYDLPDQISADEALHWLLEDADVFRVRRQRYLVAPINDTVLEALIVAAGSIEDTEDDDPGGETDFRGLPGATIDDEPGEDEEDSLGWPEQVKCGQVTAGYAPCGASEGDDDPDAEQDDHSGGNVEDGGELDLSDYEPDLVT